MLAYVGFFLYLCGQIYCVYTFAPMCTRCMLLKVREMENIVYLISYDINSAIKDYSALYDAIKGISGDYQHPLESVWLVSTPLNREQVFNLIHKEMDERDNLLIVEVKGNYYGWLKNSVWEWLKSKLGY